MSESRGKCVHKPAEAEEADKVEVAPGVTGGSLRRFRAALTLKKTLNTPEPSARAEEIK